MTKAALGVVDPTLSDRARIVLIRMSVMVLDKPTGKQAAAEYWRGWEWLGQTWDDGKRSDKAIEQIVRRALAELVAKGYVKAVGNAWHGQRQRYIITLDY